MPSQLEQKYNQYGITDYYIPRDTHLHALSVDDIDQLIKILQKERDCWIANAKKLQEQVNEMEVRMPHRMD